MHILIGDGIYFSDSIPEDEVGIPNIGWAIPVFKQYILVLVNSSCVSTSEP